MALEEQPDQHMGSVFPQRVLSPSSGIRNAWRCEMKTLSSLHSYGSMTLAKSGVHCQFLRIMLVLRQSTSRCCIPCKYAGHCRSIRGWLHASQSGTPPNGRAQLTLEQDDCAVPSSTYIEMRAFLSIAHRLQMAAEPPSTLTTTHMVMQQHMLRIIRIAQVRHILGRGADIGVCGSSCHEIRHSKATRILVV